MKYRKRKISIVMVMLLAAIMMLSASLPVLAIADHEGLEIDLTSDNLESNEPKPAAKKMLRAASKGGDISGSQSYSVDNSHNSTAGFVVFSSGGYEGSCIQKGVDYELRGTADMDKKKNTELLAKAAYYVDNVKGWFKNSSDRPAIMDRTGVGSRFRAGLLAEDILQCANQGTDRWAEIALRQTYPQGYVDYVVDIVKNTLPGVDVPPSFVIWKGSPSDGSQDFAVWGENPTGNLTVKKTLAKGTTDSSFTFKITVSGASGEYDASGAASKVTFNSSGVATVTLKGGQSVTIKGLPADASYSVSETNIPANWSLVSKSGDSGKIGADSTASVSFTNERDTGFAKVKKSSANKDITG